MTQQERMAIEAYAKEIMKSGCTSNERDFLDGLLKGAEFALTELRKPSEDKYLPNPDRKQLIDALNNFRASGDDAGCWADAIIESFEQSKPNESEPTGRMDEELIREIIKILRGYWVSYECEAAEIAKLISSSRSHENSDDEPKCVAGCKSFEGGEIKHHKDCPFYQDSLSRLYDEKDKMNVELLEAAKYFRDAWNCEWSKLTAKKDDVNKHNTVISNAEKQTK